MSYHRVIPRDLFNESNLLKCYGQIYLNLENMGEVAAELVGDGSTDQGFYIIQDDSDGSLSVLNVYLRVRGKRCHLSRPLNSREAYPLYLTVADDVISVFDDDGAFTAEMAEYLRHGVTP